MEEAETPSDVFIFTLSVVVFPSESSNEVKPGSSFRFICYGFYRSPTVRLCNGGFKVFFDP